MVSGPCRGVAPKPSPNIPEPIVIAPPTDNGSASRGHHHESSRFQVAVKTTAGPHDADARFAAVIAHELRTPLATQRALLELALSDPDADIAAWRDVGEDVLHACMQQERLLEACLVLSRSQSGLRRREIVDLGSIAAELVRHHDLQGLTVKATLKRALTNGDAQLVERLVANLLTNSIRHNITGGRIELTTDASAERALLTIANTGPLIPAGELARLFLPFQRLDSQPGLGAGGVGLGLAIVQAVARTHDAVVSAQSRPDGGLRVDVSFPLARQGGGRGVRARQRALGASCQSARSDTAGGEGF
jgi:signal transduction histidine kinase